MTLLSSFVRFRPTLVLIAACCVTAGCGNLEATRSLLPMDATSSTQKNQSERGSGAVYKLLYNFKGYSDGYWPAAGLVAEGDGFYGTTSWGGDKCGGSS